MSINILYFPISDTLIAFLLKTRICSVISIQDIYFFLTLLMHSLLNCDMFISYCVWIHIKGIKYLDVELWMRRKYLCIFCGELKKDLWDWWSYFWYGCLGGCFWIEIANFWRKLEIECHCIKKYILWKFLCKYFITFLDISENYECKYFGFFLYLSPFFVQSRSQKFLTEF